MKSHQLTRVAQACMVLLSPIAFAQSDLGSVTISGKGDRLGTGQVIEEDSTKSRSNVLRSAIEKGSSTANPYQQLDQLPGVNTWGPDATGLFGGGLTVRGFNADQIGFTVNGVPVNDSGNFAVYPQEYADAENTCNLFLTQGSTDIDSPHVGAVGGNVGVVTCAPEDKRRVRIAQSLGDLNLSRSFIRLDTGRFASDRSKLFISYSKTQADKWKGEGKADRDHVDAGFQIDVDKKTSFSGSFLYNKAINNNILSVSRAQLAQFGYTHDYSKSWPGTGRTGKLTPVAGTAQVETGPSPAYYKLSTNPFENLVASIEGKFRIADNTQLKIQPYYWYGYGTGGTQQNSITETNGFVDGRLGTKTADRDLNGDGDQLDTILVASSSVTKTHRPGVTVTVTHQQDNHQIVSGVWYERADHRQTGPAVPINADGTQSDYWFNSGRILRPDGTEFNNRDWTTVSPAMQFFAQDNISLMGDKLAVSIGVRTPKIKREFTSRPADSASNGYVPYTIERTFDDVLPQAGFRFNVGEGGQVFASVAENMKAPPNFAFSASNVNIVNGIATPKNSIEPETSTNIDIGYRLKSSVGFLSISAFQIDFKNRQANAYNPETATSTYTNAGGVKNRGIEVEFGSAPVNGWSLYGSLTHNNSEIQGDLRTGAATVLSTGGKEFPLTPGFMAAGTVQYLSGPFFSQLKVKHVGEQYADLTNLEKVPSFTVTDFSAGYKFANFGMFKSPMIRLNVSNLLDEKYRVPTGVSNTATSASSIFYNLGAPRFASITFQSDF
jgi:iron complex outermembrane receptor protein